MILVCLFILWGCANNPKTLDPSISGPLANWERVLISDTDKDSKFEPIPNFSLYPVQAVLNGLIS